MSINPSPSKPYYFKGKCYVLNKENHSISILEKVCCKMIDNIMILQ